MVSSVLFSLCWLVEFSLTLLSFPVVPAVLCKVERVVSAVQSGGTYVDEGVSSWLTHPYNYTLTLQFPYLKLVNKRVCSEFTRQICLLRVFSFVLVL